MHSHLFTLSYKILVHTTQETRNSFFLQIINYVNLIMNVVLIIKYAVYFGCGQHFFSRKMPNCVFVLIMQELSEIITFSQC